MQKVGSKVVDIFNRKCSSPCLPWSQPDVPGMFIPCLDFIGALEETRTPDLQVRKTILELKYIEFTEQIVKPS